MKLKTRIQHVNSLPEEIRQRAISRMQEQLIFIDWHEEFLSLELCLKSSFVFEKTEETKFYWNLVSFYGTDKIDIKNPTRKMIIR